VYVAPRAEVDVGADTTGGTVVLVADGWCGATVVEVADR
jgi:hypothetical protein